MCRLSATKGSSAASEAMRCVAHVCEPDTPRQIYWENSWEVEHNNLQNIYVDIISRLHVFYLAIFQKDRKKKIWHCYDISGDIPEKDRKNWLWN